MEGGLLIKDSSLILEADELKLSFEAILSETITISNGAVRQKVLDSNELVTPLTLQSEIISEDNTGICIDKSLTEAELKLISDPDFNFTPSLEKQAEDINQRAMNLVREVIKFKEKVLAKRLECKIYVNLYQLLIDHILREARYYLNLLEDIQNRTKSMKNILEQQVFWDTIMQEHALFIRGLLDPTEVELFDTANNLGKVFEELIEKTKKAKDKDIPEITKKALEATKEIRDFKATGTNGLTNCSIKAMAYPLLGDHVLREANRYIRVLKEYDK